MAGITNQLKILKTNRPFTPREPQLFHKGRLGDLPKLHCQSAANATTSRPSSKELKLPSIREKSRRKQFRPVSGTILTEKTNDKSNDTFVYILRSLSSEDSADESIVKLKRLGKNLPDSLSDDSLTELYHAIIPLITTFSSEAIVSLLDRVQTSPPNAPGRLAMSKAIFLLASIDSNDEPLCHSKLPLTYFHALSSMCPNVEAEAMVHGYGAIKYMTYHNDTLEELCGNGLLELIAVHLKVVEDEKMIFQATSCLRNILNIQTGREKFHSLKCMDLLDNLSTRYISNPEIMCNLSRLYSVLSLSFNKQRRIVQRSSIESLLNMTKMHPGKSELVVRTTFALGNIAADERREQLEGYTEFQDFLPDLLWNHVDSYDPEMDTSIVEDIIIKTIRVFANLSVSPGMGELLAVNEKLIQSLIALTEKNPPYEVELAAISAMCNLSFYPVVHSSQLFGSIMQAFNSKEEDVTIEAARALGNLTRRKHIREHMTSAISDLLQVFKEEGNPELTYAVAGIFVNLMADVEVKTKFADEGGLQVCHRHLVLKQNWPLCTLLCQVIWNFYTDFDHRDSEFRLELIETLVSLVDDSDSRDDDFEAFSVTALHLLGKISK